MKPILQIEDEESDVLFLNLAAEKVGLLKPIQIARDGREGIDYLAGNGKFANRDEYPLPCVVLLDLKLPLVPGLEVLKFIRSRPELGTLIVIVFTSSDLDSDVEKAYRLGANSYIVKPANPSELFNILSIIKSYWLRVNRLPG
jgi:CheY-like chemotaxis protein